MRALGVDIGGSAVKVAIVEHAPPSATGSNVPAWPHVPVRVCGEARSERYARPGAAELRRAVARAVSAAAGACAGAAPRAGAVAGVGVCVPGVVDEATRRVVVSVNVPGLVGLSLTDLAAEAARALGDADAAPDALEIVSDARAAAHDWWCVVGERDRAAAGAATGRLLAISLGTGVGACVLDDGRPLSVVGASSGHLGQADVSLDDDPPIGPDGGAGSLESYIGVPALAAQAGPGEDAEAVIARLRIEDAPLRALRRAIRVAHAIYRPQRIALLGGVGVRLGRSAGLMTALRESIARGLTSLARPEWVLEAGTSDFHAARGAARWALARVRADGAQAGVPGVRRGEPGDGGRA